MIPTQTQTKNNVMRTSINSLLLALVTAGISLAGTARLSAAEPLVTHLDWPFATGANPASTAGGGASGYAAIVVGEFGSGWIADVSVLGNASGCWDLGKRGSINLSVSNGPSSEGARQIRVKVTQLIDGAIYGDSADVSVPGATRSTSLARMLGAASIGGWIEDVSVWEAEAGAATGMVTVTSPERGSIIDRVVVEVEASTPVPVPLSIVTAGTDGEVTLSWPASAAGFALESTDDLSAPITWEPVPGTPSLVGDSYIITVDASVAARFFRLRKP
jgi:hypothetical protein